MFADPTVQLIVMAGGPAAVACLGWWLSGKFRDMERANTQALATHENEDQRRHVENLRRFGRLDVRLARMGVPEIAHDDLAAQGDGP
jgi:hypothetical protein